MTKNIIVLLKLLEHGEVSTNDFAGLEKGNIRHLPRIINDARKHMDIYSEEIRNNTTTEVIGLKYILPEENTIRLKDLIYYKTKWQEERKIISSKDREQILKRMKPC